MNLKSRVERLQKRRGRCRECRFRPSRVRVLYPDDEHYADFSPEFCPSCGKEIEVAVLKVVYDPPPPGGSEL